MRQLNRMSLLIGLGIFVILSSMMVQASNLLSPGQGASGLGTAYAGGAAQAEDSSTIFDNPAGIALLNDGQLQADLTGIFPTVRFSNDGSRYNIQGAPSNGTPIRGGNGGQAGIAAFSPALFISQPLFRSPQYGDLAVGVGVSVPFGLQTDYDPGWVGRYSALRSKLVTFDIQPTIAYRLWDRLSVGASVDIQYASARLTQAIDFGLAGEQAVNRFTQELPGFLAAQGVPAAAIPGTVAATQRAYSSANFVPGGRDAISEVTGNDWATGFTLGAIFEYLKGNENRLLQDGRIGFSYRSSITHEILGNVQFRGVPVVTAPGAPVQFPAPNLFQETFFDQGTSAQLSLPDVYHFSIYQQLLGQLALMGDIEWIRWSRLQSIVVKFDNPGTPSAPIQLNYGDSTRLAVGLEWFATKNFTWRCGFAYDRTPITNAKFRVAQLPDNDQYTVSLGFRWVPIPSVNIDVGYAHIFLPESNSNVADTQGHILVGKFSTAGNLASVSVTLHWGGLQKNEIRSAR
jgi:long-chain fatty acid transport protein